MNVRDHWEKIYQTRAPEQNSWTQNIPQSSLVLIGNLNLPKTARIIDVGGGDSKLVDFLIEDGYRDITVLDISSVSLDKAKARLGEKAKEIKWIRADITEFEPSVKYDCWHDRATFHFLTTPSQIENYIETAGKAIGGYMILSTFSDRGPDQCSGLVVKKYSEQELQRHLAKGFRKIECKTEDHHTPSGNIQNFIFCSFKRMDKER
jgi:2-polyprenyl-3-methyl-5-hydroxy-6-metoxy-1,4-benzoquinol methylase